MEIISFEDFTIDPITLNIILKKLKTKFINDYVRKNGEYPSVELINDVSVPDEDITNIKHYLYSQYLANVANKIQIDEFNNYLDVYFDLENKPIEYAFDENGGTIKLIVNTNNGYSIKTNFNPLYQSANVLGTIQTKSNAVIEYDTTILDNELMVSVSPFELMHTNHELNSSFIGDNLMHDNSHSSTREILIKPVKGSNEIVCKISQYNSNYNVLRNEFDWIEVPLLNDNNMQYFWHEIELDENHVYRNYSFGWNPKYGCSTWVAYKGGSPYGSSTTVDYVHDPLIDTEDIFDNRINFSYDSGYQRRKFISTIMRDIPNDTGNTASQQLGYHSNLYLCKRDIAQGVIATLEAAIRNCIRTHSYIVSGIIIDETVKVNDIYVPNKLYNTILKYNGSADKWVSSAVLIDLHTGEYQILSITDLESITGITYYPALLNYVDEASYKNIKSNIDPQIYKYL